MVNKNIYLYIIPEPKTGYISLFCYFLIILRGGLEDIYLLYPSPQPAVFLIFHSSFLNDLTASVPDPDTA